jgi:hypothetical protein
MEWKDVASVLGKFAPLLGTLIGGPAAPVIGAMVGSIFGTEATPDAVKAAILADPQAALKLATFESDNRVKLQGMLLAHADNVIAAETAQLQAVNATMQAEAQAEHWPTYSWRPFCGFVFGVTFFGCYFVLPLLKLPVPSIPFEAWVALGSILGVASWFRGKAQADPMNPLPANRG